MKTGDAQVEIWLQGAAGRSYCLAVQSKRQGRYESKRWQKPVYRWACELWEPTKKEPEGDFVRSQGGKVPTLAEALRVGRRTAEQLERAAAKKITPNRRAA